jgi:hypothetical protein
LAVLPLSNYYPLTAGSKWVYDAVDHGRRLVENHSIAKRRPRIGGERVIQRVEVNSDGVRRLTLQNFNEAGQIQLYRSTDVLFAPPIVFPRLAKVGQHMETQGELDLTMGSRHGKGRYSAEVLVVKMERIHVPAGTFSSVKIQIKLQMTADFHAPGPEVTMTVSATDTKWLAKGVGTIKEVAKVHADATINGGHQVADEVKSTALRSFSIAKAP